MRILMVSTELWPLAKVGGLADMVGSLARALQELDHDVRCVLPRYNAVSEALPRDARVAPYAEVSLSVAGGALRVRLDRVDSETLPYTVILVDHDLFRREGLYDDPSTRQGYPDNGFRWSVLCRAVHAALGSDGWVPDVVHGHDHQVGPLMGLLRWAPTPAGLPGRPATVFTVHNLGYQGIEPTSWIVDSALPWELHYPTGPLEFHGKVNLMKIGVTAADWLTTVSPGYAREIVTCDEIGGDLRACLAQREDRLSGILNGIDTGVWNPETDPEIVARYSVDELAPKARNRTALRKEMGLAPPGRPAPVLATVGRLTSQKGVDVLLVVLEQILARGAQVVVLGSGQERYESALEKLAANGNGNLAVRLGFDDALAHRIEAGADVFLMPSRYEPCGLNQMYSLRYGTVPVVRATGGLADTVTDLDEVPERANGFVFRLYEPVEFYKSVHRAIRAWRDRRLWRELMVRGMTADFSWSRSAARYVEVYAKARSAAGS